MPEWLSRFVSRRNSESDTDLNRVGEDIASNSEETASFVSGDGPMFDGSDSESSSNSSGDRKRLYVKIEPMHQPTRSEGPDPIFNLVYVNDDAHPVLINNEHFTGHAVFRCKDFEGWTPLDESSLKAKPIIPDTPYFQGHKRTFSFQIAGRFRKQWTADDVMFGTFFDKPLTLPRGYSLALNVAKRIDPSMVAVLDSPEPYMCSPLICAMNVAHIQPLYTSPARRAISVYQPVFGTANHRESLQMTAARAAHDDSLNAERPLTLPSWDFGGRKPILEENLMTSWPAWSTVPTAASFLPRSNSPLARAGHRAGGRTPAATVRRNWFLEEEHRKRFVYHPDTVYSFDFASPYVDLNRMKLKLGISIDVERYLGEQPIRYECRTRDGSVVFFSVELGRK